MDIHSIISHSIAIPRTATDTRHAAATAVVECTQVEQSTVSTAMSHSQKTQDFYYSLKKGRKEAVEGIRRGEERRPAGGARKPFSEEETTTIETFFNDYISCGKPPSTEECREFLAQHPLPRDPKQVWDKVCNLISHRWGQHSFSPSFPWSLHNDILYIGTKVLSNKLSWFISYYMLHFRTLPSSPSLPGFPSSSYISLSLFISYYTLY